MREGMSTFFLQLGLEPARVLGRLEPAFGLRPDERARRRRCYVDTHDHRLLQQELVLYREGGELVLEPAGDARALREPAPGDGAIAVTDLPASIRAAVAPEVGVRALLDQAQVEEDLQRWALLNRDEKIVAWVTYRAGQVLANGAQHDLTPTLRITPLRGFAAASERAARALADVLTPAPQAGHPLQAALAACGRPPRAKAGPAALDPDEPTDRALAAILAAQLQVCAETRAGVVEDIDVEFLHEFRVALRKARSVLKDARGAFPARELDRAKLALREVAHGTNLLRDLDVFLLARERYTALLPPELQRGLARLFDDLTRRRDRAQREVGRLLEGPAFPRAQEAIERLGSTAGASPTGPVARHARRQIDKRYRRVCKAAADIDEASPDAVLHELRIDCKRLRYGLELYGSALGDAKQAVRRLKLLQGVLGDFNDLSVQRARLLACLGRGKTGKDPAVCAAVGGLIAGLAAEQRRVRAQYEQAYAQFARKPVRATFTALTGAKGGAPRRRKRAA